MTVHSEGTCIVCQRTQADTACFPLRGQIIVTNVRDGRDGEYVGRAVRGRRGSVLGNPFKVKAEADRPEAIARYDAWLAEKVAAGDYLLLEELDRLTARFVRDEFLVLVCWCKPADCHGDVLARVIRERSAAFLAQRS
jgi:hypothetical protein